MFNYCLTANCGIKFDLKKFYHQIDVAEDQQGFFGFIFPMEKKEQPTYFVWTVLPFGYTRAPFIAKSLIKPLISKWRSLGICIVVFFDDGFGVFQDSDFMLVRAILSKLTSFVLLVKLTNTRVSEGARSNFTF